MKIGSVYMELEGQFAARVKRNNFSFDSFCGGVVVNGGFTGGEHLVNKCRSGVLVN
jgi:hypothetical protein